MCQAKVIHLLIGQRIIIPWMRRFGLNAKNPSLLLKTHQDKELKEHLLGLADHPPSPRTEAVSGE
jgi:hypothetical protein